MTNDKLIEKFKKWLADPIPTIEGTDVLTNYDMLEGNGDDAFKGYQAANSEFMASLVEVCEVKGFGLINVCGKEYQVKAGTKLYTFKTED